MAITRLNHAVLFVRDADAASAFYREAFGFEELERPSAMRAVFMRSPVGGNHHDLGLFEVGAAAPRPPRVAAPTVTAICRFSSSRSRSPGRVTSAMADSRPSHRASTQ